jgi:3-hydroxyacyl-[acyl-carrier-protein] dehydratase
MIALGEVRYYSYMNYDALYKVINKAENLVKIELCDKEHPIFQAHFPSQPILPGFIHFDLVEKLFSLTITTIKKAKFLEMVTPGEVLQYERKGNSFKVYNEQKEVASFSVQTV